ncbi:MAG: uroporphyrinogen-III C-methyltransferase [Dehalococcoidales bacterium]|nr:uroporphyrinogen-III C-methyltransferase [Dehalococcoidales bacterium]
MKNGKVYLVGAGPGDPDLISVKGINCLKKADVVFYDRLLNERLLNAAPAEAERIDVGKVAGKHTKPQDEINRLLAVKAREGKTVVRLKGGDPFVLGRGGEEGEFLKQNSILFEVIPGITSAIAVPAYAGIPVTHRGVSSSFAVITGHEDPSKATSSINWEKLATGVDTLIFLMGMGNLEEIVARLVEQGRPVTTPAAVIQDGTRPEQVTVSSSLENIVSRAQERHLVSPAIIVIGEVAGLRDRLSWFENRPLFGKRILVTRAAHQASALSQLLSEGGAQTTELPAIEIRPVDDPKELDRAILNLKEYHWIIFTSANSVAAFWQRLGELKQDSRALTGLKIGAVGPATAKSLEPRGIIADFVPKVYSSQGIVEGLEKLDIDGQRFLLPRVDIADQALMEGIERLGASADEVPVYRTVPATEAMTRAKELLLVGEIDAITFTSSSTVSNLVAAFGEHPVLTDGTKVACIGPKTAETAVKAGLKVDIMASEQTIPSLVTALEDFFTKTEERRL